MYDLVGVDGNAYSIMGYVTHAMRKEGYTKEEQDAYLAEAMSGDYDNLVAVSFDMVNRINEECGYEED